MNIAVQLGDAGWVLLRGSLVLALGCPLLLIVLNGLRIASPTLRQFACVLLFVAALWPRPLPLEIPWYPPLEQQPPPALVETVAEAPAFFVAAAETSAGANRDQGPKSFSPPSPHSGRSLGIPAPRDVIAVLWLLGVLLVPIYGLIRYGQLAAATRHSLPVEPHWQSQWDDLCREYRITRHIALLITKHWGPMIGLLPAGFRLLLPLDYWRELTAEQRRAILVHELTHYRRGDLASAVVIRLLALPFWFHPAAWRLVAIFDEAAEWACDRAAVGPNCPTPFARALERLAEYNLPTISPAVGRCAQSHPLVTRVRRVLNSVPNENSLMKKTLLVVTLVAAAAGAVVQVRLIAQDKREATIESVREEMKRVEGRLQEVKAAAAKAKEDAEALKSRVEEQLAKLRERATDESNHSDELRRRIASAKSGEEAKQLEALVGADKLNDDGLILCGFLAKEGATETVRRKALATALGRGEDGLPVLAHAYEALPAKDRLDAVEQLSKSKLDCLPVLLARLTRDADDEVRLAALTAGLETKQPLLFLALAGDAQPELAEAVLSRLSFFQGDDLQSLLYAVALKGPEAQLPAVVRKAAELKERGYPIIAKVFERKSAEARGEIVRQFKKSAVPIEQLVVKHALADEDSDLKAAAEKANAE